jgi:uncharacterized membrane protein
MNPPIASNGYAAHDAPPQMLAELHQKLDALAAQVQYLAEQAKQERQARNELFQADDATGGHELPPPDDCDG